MLVSYFILDYIILLFAVCVLFRKKRAGKRRFSRQQILYVQNASMHLTTYVHCAIMRM